MQSHFTWAWLCQSFMAVLLPHGAFLTEDRLTFTLGTAEPLGVSPPEAVDSLLIEIVLPAGPTVRVVPGFDPRTLGQVLAVLEGHPC